jgi:iron complex outermembrane receptor protein
VATALVAVVTAALAGAWVAPLEAQQEDLPDPDTIPLTVEDLTVTVTRTEAELNRTPEAVSVLGEESLARGEKQASIEEGLRFVPGVFAQNRRNPSLGDRLTVRGVGARAQFGIRGIQILADGVPMTLPSGGAAINNLDLNSVGRVEVIRGPSSPLYGNASGGVISYRTRDPWPGAFQAEPKITFGAYGFNKTTLGASGQSDDFGWRLSGSWMESDGFRDHAETESYQANLVTRFDVSEDTQLRGVFNYFDLPFAQNPSTLSRDDALENPTMTRGLIISQGAGEENAQGQAGLTLDHSFSENHRIEATAWGAFRDVWNPIPFNIIQLDRTVGGVRSEYRGGARVGEVPIRWTAGLDAGLQSDDRQEFVNEGIGPDGGRTREGALVLEQRERVINFGPFVRMEVDFFPRWRLTLGARYDDYEFDVDDEFLSDGDDSGTRDLDEFSPMAGLTFSPHAALNLYANYATAFETPTTSEFSNRPDGSGGLNPQLGPANTESFEVGAKGRWESSRLRYGLSLYTADVDGALIPFSGPEEVVFFRNAGQISRQGVELSVDWNPVASLLWRLAYTYQDSEFEDFTVEGEDFSGNREPGVPEHQLTAGLTHRAPFGLVSEADVRWVDAYPVNDANTASNWSYRVVDLRFSMDRNLDLGRFGLQPFLGIDNVFDERYNGSVVPNSFGGRYYEPAPGVNVYGGLSVSLSYR